MELVFQYLRDFIEYIKDGRVDYLEYPQEKFQTHTERQCSKTHFSEREVKQSFIRAFESDTPSNSF